MLLVLSPLLQFFLFFSLNAFSSSNFSLSKVTIAEEKGNFSGSYKFYVMPFLTRTHPSDWQSHMSGLLGTIPRCPADIQIPAHAADRPSGPVCPIFVGKLCSAACWTMDQPVVRVLSAPCVSGDGKALTQLGRYRITSSNEHPKREDIFPVRRNPVFLCSYPLWALVQFLVSHLFLQQQSEWIGVGQRRYGNLRHEITRFLTRVWHVCI